MRTRKRTKMTALVSHTTPEYSHPSEESRLRAKFNAGIITKEELHKLASFMVIVKKTTTTVKEYTQAKVFGRWISIEGLNIDMLRKNNFELR